MKLKNKSKKKKRISNFLYDFVKVTGAIPALIWFRLRVLRLNESVPKRIKGGVLIASNHVTFFDPIIVHLAFWYRRLFSLATKDLYSNKMREMFFNVAHCIKLDKNNFNVSSLHAVCDRLKEDKAVLTDYMKKNSINNMVYLCGKTEQGAKFAELDYNVVEHVDGLTLTEIRLHTGRSHQIRVQMSSRGTPVYGDMRYGGEKAKKGYLALWAYYLSFTHPVSHERMVFRVQPPIDVMPWTNFDTEKTVTVLKPED
jgi:hypothetical protein